MSAKFWWLISSISVVGTSGTRASTYDLSHMERRVQRGSHSRRTSLEICCITMSVSIRELMRGVPSVYVAPFCVK